MSNQKINNSNVHSENNNNIKRNSYNNNSNNNMNNNSMNNNNNNNNNSSDNNSNNSSNNNNNNDNSNNVSLYIIKKSKSNNSYLSDCYNDSVSSLQQQSSQSDSEVEKPKLTRADLDRMRYEYQADKRQHAPKRTLAKILSLGSSGGSKTPKLPRSSSGSSFTAPIIRNSFTSNPTPYTPISTGLSQSTII
eukprot:Pgem_evm1s6599